MYTLKNMRLGFWIPIAALSAAMIVLGACGDVAGPNISSQTAPAIPTVTPSDSGPTPVLGFVTTTATVASNVTTTSVVIANPTNTVVNAAVANTPLPVPPTTKAAIKTPPMQPVNAQPNKSNGDENDQGDNGNKGKDNAKDNGSKGNGKGSGKK